MSEWVREWVNQLVGKKERQSVRERENLNTLFYKDCSLGSVKTCLTTSPC